MSCSSAGCGGPHFAPWQAGTFGGPAIWPKTRRHPDVQIYNDQDCRTIFNVIFQRSTGTLMPTLKRFVCVHGHFYQPPRENPWLETVETQDTAAPYHRS